MKIIARNNWDKSWRYIWILLVMVCVFKCCRTVDAKNIYIDNAEIYHDKKLGNNAIIRYIYEAKKGIVSTLTDKEILHAIKRIQKKGLCVLKSDMPNTMIIDGCIVILKFNENIIIIYSPHLALELLNQTH